MAALRRIRLGELIAILVLLDEGAVDRLFKDGLWVDNLKLGPKILGMVGDGATVGATTGVGKGKVLVGNVFMQGAPDGVLVVIVWMHGTGKPVYAMKAKCIMHAWL